MQDNNEDLISGLRQGYSLEPKFLELLKSEISTLCNGNQQTFDKIMLQIRAVRCFGQIDNILLTADGHGYRAALDSLNAELRTILEQLEALEASL